MELYILFIIIIATTLITLFFILSLLLPFTFRRRKIEKIQYLDLDRSTKALGAWDFFYSILKIGFIIAAFGLFALDLNCYELDELEIKQDYKKDGVNLDIKYPDQYKKDVTLTLKEDLVLNTPKSVTAIASCPNSFAFFARSFAETTPLISLMFVWA